MQITEKNIEKNLDYLDSLGDDKFNTLIDSFIEEQAYLSTFIQQNLDNIFSKDNEIIDFSYNIYFSILFLFKSKLGNNYPIVSANNLKKILDNPIKEHKQEDLGDFIYTQYVNNEFNKEEILKVVGLLNIVILVLEE